MAEFTLLQITCVTLMIGALGWSSYIDFKHLILPDVLTLAVFVLAVVLAVFDPLIVGWQAGLIGAFAGLLGSWLLREAVMRIKKQEAMGLGDVKLFGAAGMWVGAEGVISVAFYGSLFTMVVILIKWLITRKGSLKDVVPFGPGLALGLVFTIFAGPIGPYVARLVWGY